MRVSQGMISNNMLKNISSSYGSLNKYMNQLSSGKKITRPSDDPVVAMKGMGYRSQLSNIKQYERNLGEVHNWIDNTDEAMSEVTLIMHKINDLTIQASNGTYDGEDRSNIGKEVDQLIDQLVNIANTRVNDKYLFNGTDTNGVIDEEGNRIPPFTRDEDGNFTVSNNKEDVLIEISAGVRFKVNSDPSSVFSKEFFDDLQKLADDLNNGDIPDEGIGSHLETIEGHLNKTLSEHATIGARKNRIELIENRLANQSISAESMMSDNEDADVVEVIMSLTMQEAIHRASLSAGARVLQPTLLDFLR
ncbi:flagellar hook-associated protein FlgL [Amphibacillus sp. MSJ-3]|uniref:flagellar hook-associated protein FlgL n=1 Tax=Amphibacillus sp. MSJ-3 TaxID=2841505 RepID=UPI001C0F33E9|nr:flagellar hook-associated protein FlgL [Amphibacillus sp. MSJ-3]MBU5594109.1 flagellar hook-associated protein FlgL [Amphibacillus sp. MSJ-3]